MRRLALLCTLVVAGLAVAPSAQASFTVGVSDQLAKTFFNPLYAPLKFKVARYIAPYDVMSDPAQLKRLDDWIKGARLQKVRILVSFEHSRTAGKEAKMPSISAYTKAIKAFKKVYGKDVKDISPWNEVNVCQKNGRTEGQPAKICKDPKVAASIYKAAKKVFPSSSIVVLDFLDGNNPSSAISYVRKFKKAAKPSSTAIWGLHNYSDTNRYDDSKQRTKAILKEIGKGQIWLTETGGQVTFKGRTVAQGAPLAAKALGCMFYIANKYKQIKRVYVYSFNGTPENVGLNFDSGLISSDDKTLRPGYAIVKGRKSIKCNK
jgi:hypothetical protein